MPYTPDATDTTQPADAGVKASTAAAEFRALKSYIKNNILGGTVAFTGNPTVPLLPAADATAKIASAAFVQQEITRLTGLVVNSAGNVGIGTSSPTSKLAVAGDVRALSGGALILNNPANAGAGSILFNASDALVFNRGGSVEAMRIDSSGNVGIGTSSPANVVGYGVVDVRGSSGGFYVIGTTAGGAVGRYGMNSSTGAVELNSFNANPLTFLTSSTERVRIDASGNVGIGTSSPATKLHVEVPTGNNEFRMSINGITRSQLVTDGAATQLVNTSTGGGASLQFWNNGAERVRIDASGNVGIGASTTGCKLYVNGSLGISPAVDVGSSTYAVGVGDTAIRCLVACTVTLPAAASFTGRPLKILTVGANAVASAASNVIGLTTAQAGATSTAILPATAGKWVELQSNGVNWVAIAGN